MATLGPMTPGTVPKPPRCLQVSAQLSPSQCQAVQRLNPSLWLQEDLGSSPFSTASWLGTVDPLLHSSKPPSLIRQVRTAILSNSAKGGSGGFAPP